MICDFIALDFETANQQPSSVCSIGVVMVRNGLVADSLVTRYLITSFTPLQPPVVTISRIVTMLWQTLKHVL